MIIYKQSGGEAITHEWLTFSDGQRHVTLGPSDGAVNVVIETAIKSANDLLDVLLVRDVLHARGHLVHLDIRYLLGARMDRRIDINQPATLAVICNAINSAGFSSIRVLDPHSSASTKLLNAQVVRPWAVLSRIFGNHYRSQWQDVAIVAPDAGAKARTKELVALANLDSLPIVQGLKSRDMQTGKLTNFGVENPMLVKPVCLIVDDICDGGRTFSGLAVKLLEAGARQVDLFVTHGIFSQGLPLDNINMVFCTNSFQGVDTSKGALVYNVQMREMR